MAQEELRNSLKSNHRLHWYQIDRVLGQGGFGITYLAHDPNLDQLVAIKEYLPMELAVRDGDNSVYPASAANGERYQWGLERFIVEARTLAKFKHPAIVRVLSVFEENNTAYMVMEYEHGESLQAVLERRKTLEEHELIPILAPLLDGLEIIHAAGFIHRDIKPANIYIREDGSPVLLDFGSARQALGEQTKSITSIVSPGYAPFEQYYSKSDRQGPWTDIYSLAATMYRAISGILPMDAIDRSEAILKAERDIFVTAGEIGEGRYSPQFMRALDHALNFSEKKRPQTIGEWRDELGLGAGPASSTGASYAPTPIATNEDSHLATVRYEKEPKASPADAPSMHLPPVNRTAPSKPSPSRSMRAWWIAAALIVAVVVGFSAWLQLSTGGDSPVAGFSEGLSELVSGVTGNDAEDLVARGDRALAAGRAFEPLEGSAIDYYRQAYEKERDNEGALQGMALVASRMRAATEKSIAAGELDRADQYLALLRGLPGQREKIAILEEDFRNAKATEGADVVQSNRIAEFLNEAATDIAEGRILSPSGNNALVRYRAIQMLDPDNVDAKRGIEAIVARLSEEHTRALADGDFALAEERLEQIEPLDPNGARHETLKREFDEARIAAAKAKNRIQKIEKLLSQAAADVAANRLATPASGNAIARYNEVLALDPENETALAGLEQVAGRYVELARGAIRSGDIANAKTYIGQAASLDVDAGTIEGLNAQVAKANQQREEEVAAQSLQEARERLAAEARERQEQDRMRFELEAAREAAELERRRRQEAEAKRLFEIEQAKSRAAEQRQMAQQQEQENVALEKSTLVVEFDGFDDQTEFYGLKRTEVRADVESRLQSLGYHIVLHHKANRSPHTRLFIIRFRANLNSASGVFSYAASLALYDHVPVKANSVGKSGKRPIWNSGTTGVARQNELRRVRDEYQRTMRKFVTEVGQAPGRI